MRTLVFVMVAVLAGASTAFAGDLPDGTYASSEAGCDALKAKTAKELGEDLDFYVLTKKGITTYAQRCDFVSVAPHDDKSWVATAFCDEDGYIYPDMFAISVTDTGGLAVTRTTDITQQQGSEDELPLSEDANPVQLDRDDSGNDEDDQAAAPSAGELEPATKPDGYNHYVLCPEPKQ